MGCTPIKKTKPLNTKKQERKLSNSSLDIMEDFAEVCQQYEYRKSLGYGKYGRVFLAESPETGQQVAVKALSKLATSTTRLTEEIEILAELDHPNIVKYYKHYQSNKYLYLIMEYCEGEELFSEILKCGKLSEEESLVLMEKLLRAVNHCHKLGVIHCDLKPENMMVSSEGNLKVIDFGLSMRLDSGVYQGIAGTPFYIAPEIITQGLYTKASDMWSLGITLHTMLTGYVPVSGKDFDEIKERIKNYTGPSFTSSKWKKISPEAKDLLKKLLEPSYSARITVEEALEHEWFIRAKIDCSLCNLAVLEALQRYSEFPEAKKNILAIIVRNVSDIELKEYQRIFLEVDKAKTGLITSKDLETVLKKAGNKVSRKELEELTKKVNQRGHDFISYSEFVAALIATREFLTEERLTSVFKLVEQAEVQRRGI
jgi:calcium-dependent protein kinase